MSAGVSTIGSYEVGQLSERLFTLASKAGQRALIGHDTEDPYEDVRTAIALGEAFEWLVRSAIARAHPVLLGDPSSRATLITLAGASPKVLPILTMRSVGIAEAVKVVGDLYPPLSLPKGPVQGVLSVRNAAAHMTMVDPEETHAALQDLTSLVASLLGVLDLPEERFWGSENVGRVAELKHKRLGRLDAAREAKLVAARVRYDELVWGLSDTSAERLKATLSARFDYMYLGDDVGEHHLDCPACGSRASVAYLRSEASDDEIVERGDFMVRPVWLTPESLRCPVCALILDQSELGAMSLNYVTESDDPIEVDISPNFEPDPDFFPTHGDE